MSNAPLKNVVLIGANGSLGAPILKALLAKPDTFNVTILTRASSTSTFPDGVPTIKIPDGYPHADLVQAFKGQDAVINAIRPPPGTHNEVELQFVNAAVEAGVRRHITGHFAGDFYHEGARAFNPEIAERGRTLLEELKRRAEAGELNGLTWTSVANGMWLDWGLRLLLSGPDIDIANHKVQVYDSGTRRFSATTLAGVAHAVVGVLEHPAETANRQIYVQDLALSFRDVVAALERQTGATWEVTSADSKPAIAMARQMVAGGNPYGAIMLITLGLLADVEPDAGNLFEASHKLDNEVVGGLPKVDLDEVVAEALKSVQQQKQ